VTGANGGVAAMRIVDEIPGVGFGWIAPTPAVMQRASHAIAVDGRVWVLDPVWDDGILGRIRALGEPAGVVQQIDRHPRDCERVASELDVPLYVVPDTAPPGAPFEVRTVIRSRIGRWDEVALWFPDVGVLAVGEAVGGAPYFCAPGETMGPHPLLRLFRPPRALVGIGCDHLVFGHGPGVHGPDTARRLDAVILGARADVPRWVAGLVRSRGR
jgi:hypothetical protein